MTSSEKDWGLEIVSGPFTIGFGNIRSSKSVLESSFPGINFFSLTQVHGNHIVLGSASQHEADAHFTNSPNSALLVSTADCIPCMLACPKTLTVMAIHAGWRGLAKSIIPLSIEKMISLGAAPEGILAFIGPHIQKRNFEVETHVAEEILSTVGSSSKKEFCSPSRSGKVLVDLNLVAKMQLFNSGVLLSHLFDYHIDTFESPLHHSFRRDRKESGRQLSFIFINQNQTSA
ncbi:MAG: polyphenol oxidase family protein [Bdellovibrionaceae bacterium]|nr:polyphenol oxidase family protein [Pseudobdellovibrionaceae bacterium]